MGSITKSSYDAAIFGVWRMQVLLLLSCLVQAHQFDDTFDPITRRALVAGTQGRGGGHPVDPAQHPVAGGAGFKVVDISHHNARGDGASDSTQAVKAAWAEVCKSTTPSKLLIPKGTWLTAELDFRGPCAAPQIVIEIQGILLAKPDKQSFPRGFWINIMGVHGVVINGGGTLNAQGEKVWHTRGVGEKGSPLPDSLVLAQSNDSRIENIILVNAKGFNMKVYENENVVIQNVHITSPDESPNTDGIHIGRIKNVRIIDSFLGVGDDCISIGDGSIDVFIRNIMCGPGHGISVGSLGRFAYETDVRNVWVENCTFTKTLNGARIKTFRESPPLAATNITYTNLIMNDVYTPINIDQNYASSKPSPSKVKLSNIKFRGITGTTSSNFAITLNCSSAIPCQGVELFDIDIRYIGNHTKDKTTHAICDHANAKFGGRMFPPPCKQG